MTSREITVTVNGQAYTRAVEPRLLLSDFLRHELHLTGTHVGCEHGVCGACTVLLDGVPVRSCLTFAVQAGGHVVGTVEGLAADPDPYQGWHSSQSETGYNFANWSNPQADQALEEGRLTTDQAKRKAAYATFQQLFAAEVPSLVLYYPQYHFAVSKKITGVTADPLDTPADRFRTIAEWKFKSAT